MPLSYAELKSMLDVDEPDYPALATMAAGAMTHLRKLAASPDVSIASKAVSLAGMIGSSGSVAVVGDAAKSDDAIVRAAAAHAASYLPDTPKAASVVSTLLADKDIGVVKLAARAAAGQGDRAVTAQAKRAVARVESTDRATQTDSWKGKASGNESNQEGGRQSSAEEGGSQEGRGEEGGGDAEGNHGRCAAWRQGQKDADRQDEVASAGSRSGGRRWNRSAGRGSCRNA